MLNTREIIKKYKIKANKQLGQNFLINEEICARIALLGKIEKSDSILEIGPGLGSLTKQLLLSKANKIYAIEKDENFISILKKEIINESDERFNLIQGDALKIGFLESNFKIIANLPYNIGTELLTRWIESEKRPSLLILMLQKEVAMRITAKAGSKDYGRLSVLCQAFYNCKMEFDVPKNSFIPEPNVASSIVHLRRKENVEINAIKLGKVTRALFMARRKIAKHALHSLNIKTRPDLEQKRAECLSVEDFISLIS
jgi:16S rRNA (adenine1518-N6/adenine1519-N6)-dimethyltransferase